MSAIIQKFKKIKCPNCHKEVVPEVLNSKADLKFCPLCKQRISG